jgi:hypothetical protein
MRLRNLRQCLAGAELLPEKGGGVYLLQLNSGEEASVYIGQSESLPRRFSQYRRPGPSQFTNIRMNARMLEHLTCGGSIRVWAATSGSVVVNGQESPIDLAAQAERLLAETSAIVSQLVEGEVGFENL